MSEKCGHELEYQYFGGTFGYDHCPKCDRWWQVDLNGSPPEHGKEVRHPHRRDLLTDFVEGTP